MNSKFSACHRNVAQFVEPHFDGVFLNIFCNHLKFKYSEKASKVCEIFPLLLSYVVPVKSKEKISQNFVAFSEYMKFNIEMLFFSKDNVINYQVKYKRP